MMSPRGYFVCLLFAITVSGLPAVGVLAADPESLVVVEAEDFGEQRKDDKRHWHVLRAGGEMPSGLPTADADRWIGKDGSVAAKASGEAFVRLLPDTRTTHDDKLIRGENFSPEPGQMAILDYPIEIEKPGRYYVWVRAYSTGTEDNGIHVGIDGEWPESGQRMQWCEGKRSWRWECAQRTQQNHCGEPMQIYLEIAEPGPHVVSFSMREDGFAFDQFVLSPDVQYRPEGTMRATGGAGAGRSQ